MLLAAVALFAVLLLIAASLAGLSRATLSMMLVRPSLDRLLDGAKLTSDAGFGPGAAINFVIVALAGTAVLRRPRALLTPVMLCWGAFLIVAGASAAISAQPALGLKLWLALLTYGAVLALTSVVARDITMLNRVVSVCLASSLVPTVVAIAEVAANAEILLGDERAQGTFTHPNILAFYVVTILAVALFALSSATRSLSARQRALLFAYVLVLLLVLAATKTRSAWIGAAILLGAYALVVDRRWLTGMALLPFMLAIPGVGERLVDLSSGTTEDTFVQLNSFAWRRMLWADAWTWMNDHPPRWLGHGLDQFVTLTPLFFVRTSGSIEIGAHNALLQIYFETGMLGALTYAAAMLAVAWSLARRAAADRNGTVVASALWVASIVFSSSDNTLAYLQYQWTLLFFIGAVCAARPRAAASQTARSVVRPAIVRLVPGSG